MTVTKDDIQDVMMLGYIQGREDMREEIIHLLMKEMYNIDCCCDSASFGDHYLSNMQYDNIPDFIRKNT